MKPGQYIGGGMASQGKGFDRRTSLATLSMTSAASTSGRRHASMSNIFKTGLLLAVLTAHAGAHRRRHRRPAGHDDRVRPGPGHELLQLLVLGQDRARDVPRPARRRGPGARRSTRIVRRLATRAGMPMPRVYIIPERDAERLRDRAATRSTR